MTNADLAGSLSVVLFLGVNCPACERLSDALLAGSVPDLGANLIVSTNDAELARLYSLSSAAVTIVSDEERVFANVFDSDRTPHAFILDVEARVIASGSPGDLEALRELVHTARSKGGETTPTSAAAVVAK